MTDHGSDNWDDVRQQFRRIAAREGFRRIADEIPASHTTVYRLVSGAVSPSRAVRAGVERIVKDRTEQEQE